MSKSNVLIEGDAHHMYTRQEVKVRVGVLERVDHVVWHIRASACPAVHPSVTWEEGYQCFPTGTAYARTWATSADNVFQRLSRLSSCGDS